MKANDDGAFITILKTYFDQLDQPLYPDNPKAQHLTVSDIICNWLLVLYWGICDRNSMSCYPLPTVNSMTLQMNSSRS